MLSVLKTLSSAGSKIIATFFMVLILIMLSVLFFPQGFNLVSDAANHLANLEIARNPPVSERGKTLVRLFINEASIFGILITLIARMVVEILILLGMFLCAWSIHPLCRRMNPNRCVQELFMGATEEN